MQAQFCYTHVKKFVLKVHLGKCSYFYLLNYINFIANDILFLYI